MHTATQLKGSMFDVKIGGAPATRETLLPDWQPHDRLGVVVTQPLGGIGASLLLQLAITAFYDIRPSRRDENRIHYPDFYLFHVGGPHGSHMPYDFWPPRKEAFLEDDPRVVLDAINDKGITRLAVVDGRREPAEFSWKERESALDRIATAVAYSATGAVADPDVEITGTDPRTEENTSMTLEPQRLLDLMDSLRASEPADAQGGDPRVRPRVLERWDEIDPQDHAHATTMRKARLQNGLASETYRRISVEEALDHLYAMRA